MPDRHRRFQQANSPLGRTLRYIGLLVGILIGWQIGVWLRPVGPTADRYGFPVILAAALGALFFLVTPYLTLGFINWLRQEVRRLSALDVVSAGIGLLAGGLLSALLAWPLSLLPRPAGQLFPSVAAILICSMAVVAAVTKKREILTILGRSEAAAAGGNHPPSSNHEVILLDTSAIIDGRVADLARIGLIRDELLVPNFVLRELQLVADSAEPSRRVRGRRGLDILERMKQDEHTRLTISDVDVPEENDVDNKLVRLAKSCGYIILTGDQNLDRVGALQGVLVLNIHEIAHVVRPALVAGEEMALKIIQAGREMDQGVGFLDDGTMVVVESGKDFIGETVRVVVTRTLQTGAGRMAFAQVKEAKPA